MLWGQPLVRLHTLQKLVGFHNESAGDINTADLEFAGYTIKDQVSWFPLVLLAVRRLTLLSP